MFNVEIGIFPKNFTENEASENCLQKIMQEAEFRHLSRIFKKLRYSLKMNSKICLIVSHAVFNGTFGLNT